MKSLECSLNQQWTESRWEHAQMLPLAEKTLEFTFFPRVVGVAPELLSLTYISFSILFPHSLVVFPRIAFKISECCVNPHLRA